MAVWLRVYMLEFKVGPCCSVMPGQIKYCVESISGLLFDETNNERNSRRYATFLEFLFRHGTLPDAEAVSGLTQQQDCRVTSAHTAIKMIKQQMWKICLEI